MLPSKSNRVYRSRPTRHHQSRTVPKIYIYFTFRHLIDADDVLERLIARLRHVHVIAGQQLRPQREVKEAGGDRSNKERRHNKPQQLESLFPKSHKRNNNKAATARVKQVTQGKPITTDKRRNASDSPQ